MDNHEIDQGPHTPKRRNSVISGLSEARWDDVIFIMSTAILVGVLLGHVLKTMAERWF
jgi:hypothetical protein